MTLTKDGLLLASKTNLIQKISIEGIGTVCVRKLSYDDVMGYVRGETDEDERSIMVRLVIAGVCDEEGKPLFTKEDAAEVGAMDTNTVRKLAEAVQEHGGILPEDDAEGN